MVHKLDRFARSMLLALVTLHRIDYRLICLDPPVDFTTPVGRVQANIMMAFNQYYSDNLSEEVKKGLYERREQGMWLGHLPFGAARQDGDGEGKLPPIPDRAIILVDSQGRSWSRYDALQHIFKRASEGKSLASICQEINAIGFDLSQSTVHYMLTNRFYLGELPIKGKNKNRVEEWKQGAHEPLVDQDIFEAAATGLRQNKRGSAKVRARARVYPLTGLCRCGRCNAPLHCDTAKGKARLHCYSRWKRRDCDQPIVQQGKIQAQLLQHLRDLHPPENVIPQLLDTFTIDTRDTSLERQRLERKQQRLKTLYLNSEDLSLEEYEAEKAEIVRRLALLAPVAKPDDATRNLLRYLRDFMTWWQDASDEERNKMLRHILTTVVVDDGLVTAVGVVPEADRLLWGCLRLGTEGWDTSSRPRSIG